MNKPSSLFLLLGPPQAGKTALLTHADIQFTIDSSRQKEKKCVEYGMKNAVIFDVPGKLIYSTDTHNQHFLNILRKIKSQENKKNISGVIIALPLPELILKNKIDQLDKWIAAISGRITEIHNTFHHMIPCYFIITKCDLLPGFNEFFSESTLDETNKSWGFQCHSASKDNKLISEQLENKYNELIKKLNQQLLWRLHHERNLKSKSLIKDFPYQVEQLKKPILLLSKKMIHNHLPISFRGIYFTSAIQNQVNDEPETIQNGLQIFKNIANKSRSFFIKPIFTHHLSTEMIEKKQSNHRLANAVCFVFLLLLGLISMQLGRDFYHAKTKLNEANQISNRYLAAANQMHTPFDELLYTVQLVKELNLKTAPQSKNFNLKKISHYYSERAQTKINRMKERAIRDILLPELKIYLGEYLKNPVNKNIDSIYIALKSYLMLGDKSHFDSEFILNTLDDILPEETDQHKRNVIHEQVKMGLLEWHPMTLNANLIEKTREFLISTPSFQLSYIILKTDNVNHTKTRIDLGDNAKSIFKLNISNVSTMFTAARFPQIFSEDTRSAANETLLGNWVLGSLQTDLDTTITQDLLEELRHIYMKNYVKAWEKIVFNIHLIRGNSLREVDDMIVTLMGQDSPLLHLLQIIYANSAFKQLSELSPSLHRINELSNKMNSPSHNLLYDIFMSLQFLHQNLQTILQSPNQAHAAFKLVSERTHNIKSKDAITEMRKIAEKSPEPIKTWLNELSNNVWYYLLQESNRHLNTAQNNARLSQN